MIHLDEQYIYHNGIMVLPDYSNPRQFYYLPPPPRLVEDPQTGRKLFKILKLVGGLTDPIDDDGALRTGVVFFDCDLRLTEEEQDDLEEAVRNEVGTTVEINLSPILYKDGEVTCYVLGEQDWDETTVEDGRRSNVFVEKLAGFGKPSLYGDNRATFSARMTQEGTTALEASFAGGGVIGISVVYTLEFDALRPAFKFKVKADWERIYHFLEEKFKLDLFFVTYEKTNIVEELEEEQLISFEEVIIEEGAKSEVRELRKQVQEYILEKFFEPVLSVGDPAHGRVPGLVHDILRATVVVPTVGYRRVELTQEERKALSYDVTQTSAVERVIYPQAHLIALIPAAELPGYVQEVNTDEDLFFRQLNVQCSLGGCDFGKHKIAWIHPYIRYGDPPEEGTDKIFQSKDDRMQFTTWLQPNHGFRYCTGYEVEFEPIDETDPDAIFGQELTYTSPEETRTDRELAINPFELFDIHSVEFGLVEDFRREKYPVVEVLVKHEDADGYKVDKTYVLKGADGNRSALFRVRTRRGVDTRMQYRLVYHQSEGLPIPREWELVEGSFVVVGDPFPSVLQVGVRVADRPEELVWADVVLRYRTGNGAAGYQEERFFFAMEDLTDPTKMRKMWVVHTDDPNQQRFEYMFTIFYQDGTMLESPGWIESEARTLTVGRLARPYRTVTVRSSGPSFDDEELRDIKVTLVHHEPDEDQPQPVELVFENEDQTGEFTYQVGDPVHLGYDYEIRYRWRNGQVKRVQGTAPTGKLDLNIPTAVD